MTVIEDRPRALQHFDIDDGFEDIMAAVDEDGSAIVERFVGPELLARLNAELDAPIDRKAPGSADVGQMMGWFWGQQTKRFTRLAAVAPSFAELIDNEFMHRWARRDLKAGYWLNTGQAMIVGPGQGAQFLHRDIAIWPFIETAGHAAPQAMVSILIALSDFTEAVGATRIIPGSHKWPDFHTTPDPSQTVSAVMPAGSAVLYLGKTVHAAGANVTESEWRRGLHMSFCLGWLTPEEANPISVPWEIARTYPPRVQQMLGYASPARAEGAAPTNWLVDFEDVRKHLGVPYERPS
ncbi:MAG TPA: phytanoyl-CoA dioxygenase family protein [Caulobacteraceae bacterium]|jgi:ectoine hydroxylase-related dioxygenase (phytanoyl-CoA dioxygenase family)